MLEWRPISRLLRPAVAALIAFLAPLSAAVAEAADSSSAFGNVQSHREQSGVRPLAAAVRFLIGIDLENLDTADLPLPKWGMRFRSQLVQSGTGVQPGTARLVRIKPDVLGSTALPFRAVPMAERWQAILADGADLLSGTSCRNSTGACSDDLVGSLSELVTVAANLPPKARLQLINSAVNKEIIFRSDRRSYGKIDHWATFSEVVERGAGDCEDFAIMKMWLLKAAGVPTESMQLVVVRDARRGLYHAVLAVREAGETFILDNADERVRRDAQLSEYIPVYSLGWQGAWIHGFQSGPAAVAEGPLDSVYPGEPVSRQVAGRLADGSGPLAVALPSAR